MKKAIFGLLAIVALTGCSTEEVQEDRQCECQDIIYDSSFGSLEFVREEAWRDEPCEDINDIAGTRRDNFLVTLTNCRQKN